MDKLLEDLNWRYAVKQFDNTKKISDEDLGVLLESLRLSASSFGLQPWKFVVISNQDLKNKLKEHSWNQPQITDCSHLVVLCTNEDTTAEDVEKFVQDMAKTRGIDPATLDGYKGMMTGFVSGMDKEKRSVWMKDQVYIALGTLLTAAAVKRIDACPIEGFIASKYDEVLGLDKLGLKSGVICALGHRSKDDKYANAPKVRYNSEDIFVHLD